MKDVNTVQGKETMERFKMEAASEVGVNLKNGYNGDLTSREAGSVGGQMVNLICPFVTLGFKRNTIPCRSNTYPSEITYQLSLLFDFGT